MKIIDSHSHYLPLEIVKSSSFYHPGWSDIEGELKAMDEFGIEKAVLNYPTTDAHLKLGDGVRACKIYNDGLSAAIKKYPNKFIGLGILPIGDNDRMIYEFERCIKELCIRGVSLASSFNGVYPDDKLFYPLYEACQRGGIPIFIHTQTINPIGFDRVADPLITPVIEYVFDMSICVSKMMMTGIFSSFPELKFVFAHFAGVLPFLKDRFDTVYTMLRQRNIVKDLGKAPSEILKNIYCDTGAAKTKNTIEMALDMFGPQHLLWGSDYPANSDIGASLRAIEALDISDKQKEDILSGNLERLLNGGIILCK